MVAIEACMGAMLPDQCIPYTAFECHLAPTALGPEARRAPKQADVSGRWGQACSAHLSNALQVELAEGALEAGLALGDVAGDVVPVGLHVPAHVAQVQDLLQAGPRLRLLLDQRLHQLLQVAAVVGRDGREFATAATHTHTAL